MVIFVGKWQKFLDSLFFCFYYLQVGPFFFIVSLLQLNMILYGTFLVGLLVDIVILKLATVSLIQYYLLFCETKWSNNYITN